MLDLKKYINSYGNLITSDDSINKLEELYLYLSKSKQNIFVFGNGGSAAIADHFAVDMTKNANKKTFSLNTSPLITCLSNDYGYDMWMQKALEMYADKGDLAILISSSGQSQNMVLGAKKAKEMSLELVTLSGFSGENPLRQLGQVNLWADSNEYNIVEMSHHIWLVALVDFVIDSKN